MRTAEEILKSNDWQLIKDGKFIKELTRLINEARKEAIEECANRIDLFADGKLPEVTKRSGARYMSISEMYKQSFLSLINELK